MLSSPSPSPFETPPLAAPQHEGFNSKFFSDLLDFPAFNNHEV
jgi:hypothetical protein